MNKILAPAPKRGNMLAVYNVILANNPLTTYAIARLAGTSKKATIRALDNLGSRGFIVRDGNVFYICTRSEYDAKQAAITARAKVAKKPAVVVKDAEAAPSSMNIDRLYMAAVTGILVLHLLNDAGVL